MPDAKFEKPTVTFSKTGVLRVKASDILLSKVGRDEIRKAAQVAVAHDLRHTNKELRTPQTGK